MQQSIFHIQYKLSSLMQIYGLQGSEKIKIFHIVKISPYLSVSSFRRAGLTSLVKHKRYHIIIPIPHPFRCKISTFLIITKVSHFENEISGKRSWPGKQKNYLKHTSYVLTCMRTENGVIWLHSHLTMELFKSVVLQPSLCQPLL